MLVQLTAVDSWPASEADSVRPATATCLLEEDVTPVVEGTRTTAVLCMTSVDPTHVQLHALFCIVYVYTFLVVIVFFTISQKNTINSPSSHSNQCP